MVVYFLNLLKYFPPSTLSTEYLDLLKINSIPITYSQKDLATDKHENFLHLPKAYDYSIKYIIFISETLIELCIKQMYYLF